MAKGQKRSNRELRKPKAKKPVATASAPALPAREFLNKTGTPKTKG
jgi:hypothetical protein